MEVAENADSLKQENLEIFKRMSDLLDRREQGRTGQSFKVPNGEGTTQVDLDIMRPSYYCNPTQHKLEPPILQMSTWDTADPSHFVIGPDDEPYSRRTDITFDSSGKAIKLERYFRRNNSELIALGMSPDLVKAIRRLDAIPKTTAMLSLSGGDYEKVHFFLGIIESEGIKGT